MTRQGGFCLSSAHAAARKPRSFRVLVLAASLTVLPSVGGAQPPFEPRNLQLEFGLARDLILINRVADLPADGRDKLAHFAVYGMAEPGTELADIGMDWSNTDARKENAPWGQHRFSAVSKSLLSIVFVTAGNDVQYHVILAPRHSTNYCLFKIEKLGEFHLSLSTVQNLLRPDRDQTVSKTPVCLMTSVGKPIR
jgi:hypothetical protein